MNALDGMVRYDENSLPSLSSLSILFLSILVWSLAIASDVGRYFRPTKKKVRIAGNVDFTSIAMLVCEGMGGDMAMRFAESGINVSLWAPTDAIVDALIKKGEDVGYHDKIHKRKAYKDLCVSVPTPRLLVLSLPHDTGSDEVLKALLPNLSNGDIILDCGSEHLANIERRQEKCKEKGVKYIGSGIIGGYQAARAGPWICATEDESALEEVILLLRRVAKCSHGKPSPS
ncbi:NAD(P)-binding protein [Amniculicola lignicola CBS 123094]|uniref:NAD(P)-binding protein n=1 Tax=Amniculicola lignicola CBS 123094 TaxID=1392246 RepID=A0A6A5WWU0_9PLEO|nr:NAD(P)-binding protein [Amniculicola lignicola CBS 123094]